VAAIWGGPVFRGNAGLFFEWLCLAQLRAEILPCLQLTVGAAEHYAIGREVELGS
jgi:hypothetical protein